MRLSDQMMHAMDHSAYSNIGIDDHHDAPENIEIANTTLSVPGFLVGPANWDITLPDSATVVKFVLRSNHGVANGGAKAGVTGIASETQFAATTMTIGGHGVLATTGYNMVYSKASSDINLSDKVFSSGGTDISLTQAYILTSGTRILRLEWTNYNLAAQTLNCWGEVGVIG